MIAISTHALAAAIETVTGLVLMVHPSGLVWLLLGSDLPAAGQALGRIAGFALVALGWACWPRGKAIRGKAAASLPLLTYNFLITIYLAYLGVGEGFTGKLLWPAVAVHAVLSVMLLLIRFFGQPNKNGSDGSDRSAAR